MRISAAARPGLFLILVTLAALICANSPLASLYAQTFGSDVARHWINDGLMTIFFFQIGLEIKYEFLLGELASRKKAALPLAAALGGMIVPILIFVLFNGLERGWAIPMATDIAFSLALLSLFMPNSKLRAFLMALAIVDDLGAILVIAFFYSTYINWIYLLSAFAVLALAYILNRKQCVRIWPYAILSTLVWYMMLDSGIHATIGGVLAAFMIPLSTGEKLRHRLENSVTWLIMPIFAFSNAGLTVSRDGLFRLGGPLALGILLGLVLGKPIGILSFAFLGEKLGLLVRPKQSTWPQLTAVALFCGIGFTMSLFISSLAFEAVPENLSEAKMAVLLASVAAGIAGALFVWSIRSVRRS